MIVFTPLRLLSSWSGLLVLPQTVRCGSGPRAAHVGPTTAVLYISRGNMTILSMALQGLSPETVTLARSITIFTQQASDLRSCTSSCRLPARRPPAFQHNPNQSPRTNRRSMQLSVHPHRHRPRRQRGILPLRASRQAVC
ncbi:hypothetical protein OE88DRAFT_262150 [Heliocybe sulcata]|uniref:Secreted protein n=1 Tax=Heliocybe sulcata TaxID=5364 RepID=A0A5C3N009_9AGAM|nr:hypothetical protein OE88DRAFT_262150 [Heliocybe sulcata]